MATSARAAIAAMEGGGFYNRHSSLQAAGIAAVLPLWEKAARSVEIADETLVIADYGSSQGHNSMAPVRLAIEMLRAKAGADRPVEVIHTDLPSNDFASLFKTLKEERDSYMAGRIRIYPSAIGRSYFEPILPPQRVHLGWNSWTLQWMSRNPVDAPDHVFAAFSAFPAVRAAVAEQQAEDWRRFLQARSFELRPGARLLSLFVGKTADSMGWEWLGGELWAAVLDMGRAGLLSEQEQLRITLPTAGRSLSDIQAPFAEQGHFEGLQLEHAEIIEGPDPFWDDFRETGDAAHLGRCWANMMRAVFGPTIMAAIDPDRDRGALVEEFFARFAARVSAAPRRNEHFFAVVVLDTTDYEPGQDRFRESVTLNCRVDPAF